MASNQQFRSAFNGFNREDVVHYIEYMNNQHNAQIQQLNAQLQSAQAKAAEPSREAELQAALDEALARCAQLEEQLAAAKPAAPVAMNSCTAEELEAYRRAERFERSAKERSQQIYDQANAVLADVTVKTEAASRQVSDLAEQVNAQIREYQQNIGAAKEAFREAVDALYALRPEEI